MAKTYMKLDGNLVPVSVGTVGTVSKEEQTKTVTEPNFSSGNVVVTPDSGKVLTQVTVVKDNDLVPKNIVKDVDIFGVVGTAEAGGGDGGGDILYFGSGSGYYANDSYDGRILLLHVNNIQQDFPSIVEPRGVFMLNDGTLIAQGQYYMTEDNSIFNVSNTHMIIFSDGEILFKFDISFPEE